MKNQELQDLKTQKNVGAIRMRMAEWVESDKIQYFIVVVILVNAVVLGLETSAKAMESFGGLILLIDRICLAIFVSELGIKLVAYQSRFWRSSWNLFDLAVIAVAVVPGTGPWSVLRTLRVLRVLRLLTVIPSLRKVVAAFLHSIPGLAGVAAVMSIFFYTAGVLATKLFGPSFPEWFGTLGKSLYTLFQIMTLESWSMGIVRPVMETFPLAWMFFVPFIIIATFTILNLFIGIIVSTMQELSIPKKEEAKSPEIEALLDRIENDLRFLREKTQSLPSIDAGVSIQKENR